MSYQDEYQERAVESFLKEGTIAFKVKSYDKINTQTYYAKYEEFVVALLKRHDIERTKKIFWDLVNRKSADTEWDYSSVFEVRLLFESVFNGEPIVPNPANFPMEYKMTIQMLSPSFLLLTFLYIEKGTIKKESTVKSIFGKLFS